MHEPEHCLHQQQVPGDVKFNYFDAEGNMQDISVEDLTKGKKVRCCLVALFHSVWVVLYSLT